MHGIIQYATFPQSPLYSYNHKISIDVIFVEHFTNYLRLYLIQKKYLSNFGPRVTFVLTYFNFIKFFLYFRFLFENTNKYVRLFVTSSSIHNVTELVHFELNRLFIVVFDSSCKQHHNS